ncbi:SLC35F6 isoform 3 [Pan troglodytes]|nr:SLC35F6 isoform 3 [Pan troglodytes]PNJ58802.1 SLC35F6 isoform 1 [Pongo abelii]
MAWTKYQLFLAGLMLVTGSINTLSAKQWACSWENSPAWLPSTSSGAEPQGNQTPA